MRQSSASASTSVPGRRVAVVQQFPNIITTCAHDVEPVPRDSAELDRLLIHPGIDGRVPSECTGQLKESAHLGARNR
jgi:hypothetical protein